MSIARFEGKCYGQASGGIVTTREERFRRLYDEALLIYRDFLGNITDMLSVCVGNQAFSNIQHHYQNSLDLCKGVSESIKLLRPIAKTREERTLVTFLEKSIDRMMCLAMEAYHPYLAKHELETEIPAAAD